MGGDLGDVGERGVFVAWIKGDFWKFPFIIGWHFLSHREFQFLIGFSLFLSLRNTGSSILIPVLLLLPML